MATRRRPARTRASGPQPSGRRRRTARVVAALAGSLVAAAGGWLAAGGRPPAPDPRAGTRPAVTEARMPAPLPLPLRLEPGALADPVVRGGRLELPIVDFTELLPGCHK